MAIFSYILTAVSFYFIGQAVNRGIYIHLIVNKLNKIMATQEQFEQVLNRIDAATTEAANDLRALRDQIANGGITAEAEAAILARLEATATQLEAIGADPENPVPIPVL